jgi:hypothetical protein
MFRLLSLVTNFHTACLKHHNIGRHPRHLVHPFECVRSCHSSDLLEQRSWSGVCPYIFHIRVSFVFEEQVDKPNYPSQQRDATALFRHSPTD